MSLTLLDDLGQTWQSLPTYNFNKIALFIIYLVDFKVTQANSIQDFNLMSWFHLEGVELISEYHTEVPHSCPYSFIEVIVKDLCHASTQTG